MVSVILNFLMIKHCDMPGVLLYFGNLHCQLRVKIPGVTGRGLPRKGVALGPKKRIWGRSL